MEHTHNSTNTLSGSFTSSESDQLQQFTQEDRSLIIDEDVFRVPFSYLQGPFLFASKHKCRLYAEDAVNWYDIKTQNMDKITLRLRGFVALVVRTPSLYGSFDRWCAAAVIKHYRIFVYLKETHTKERYNALMRDLEIHLYNSITRGWHIPRSERGVTRNHEFILTKFLMQETALRYEAQEQNQILLKTLWRSHDQLRYIPSQQTKAVYEQGSAILQALKRNWILIMGPLEMLEREDYEKIQTIMHDDKECLILEVQCLMQSSVDAMRPIPEQQ